MKIVFVRRISQVFFFLLFIWFCFVLVLGDRWYQLRGWPVNWFLELDPLVAIGTVLTSGQLYGGLLWAVVTLVLTVFLGRVFCGWVCPFGTMHQFLGWVFHRDKRTPEKAELNKYRPAQAIKYYILAAMIGAAGTGLVYQITSYLGSRKWGWITIATVIVICVGLLVAYRFRVLPSFLKRRYIMWGLGFAVAVGVLSAIVGRRLWGDGLLLTGILDPIPLVYRSVTLFVLGIGEGLTQMERYYVGAWLIGTFFIAALLLNAIAPRFYCRFICPLGALFGLLVRWTPCRIGKTQPRCSQCGLCQKDCEGASDPHGRFRVSECVLCMNCLHACPRELIKYGPDRSASGEFNTPKIDRRGFIITLGAGVLSVPALRLTGLTGPNWSPRVIRPPGALAEAEFLKRCIKCGQCMKICPSNIIQPALLEAGVEGIWTPILNFRIGTSGCQLNCVACSNVCPTGALRPLTVEEKLGRGQFASQGPVKLGTASVDHGRCLPWAKDTPCIVCQEVCPVTPKAIYVREVYRELRDGLCHVVQATNTEIVVDGPQLTPGKLGSGDYAVRLLDGPDQRHRMIINNTANVIIISPLDGWDVPPSKNTRVAIELRLQLPYVDPNLCIGCGMCEHECPVSGLRAIRVTAENESREKRHALTI